MANLIKRFPKMFWVANTIELFERWAWYGMYMALALYLVNSKDTGALGFTNIEKGVIMGTGSMLLYFLPVITGAISDKVGYKRILMLSFTMYASGYYMLRTFQSYELVFFAFIWTCVGGAFFKPIISAIIAKSTDEKTSSLGFGIFYMMINIGGFIGPFIAGMIYQKSWDMVFYISIAAIGVNYLLTFFLLEEPVKKEKGTSLGKNIVQALKNIIVTLNDWKYLIFLVIMILFWTAFNQLYYSFPVFVDQWVNTSIIYDGIHSVWPWLAMSIGTEEGTITAVTMGSFDAFFIILFQIMVSTFVARFKPLNAMMGGILVLSLGLTLMFGSQHGWIIMLGMLIFSLGEMGSSPKFSEYVGRIAPDDKKALYMGSSFLPIAAAHSVAGYLSGPVYENISDKIALVGRELASRNLSIQEVSDSFTKQEYLNKAAELLNVSNGELTQMIWDKYRPDTIWYIYAGVAISAVVLLFVYDRFILRTK